MKAMTYNLRGQIEHLHRVADDVDTQLRYAVDAGSVIDACKHRSTAAPWLFGYSGGEDE